MVSPWSSSFVDACAQAYAEAFAYHGNLNLDATSFELRLQQIVDHQFKPQAGTGMAGFLVGNLHTKDVYLTCACTAQSELAWERFLLLYGDYIRSIARWVAPAPEAANELAGSLPGHLFLPDRSGRIRIASYDGRTTLATWLRIILTRQAINEHERKASRHGSLDEAHDVVDEMAYRRVELDARTAKYGAMVQRVLEAASATLTARERLMILWKYKDGLSESKIAGLLEIRPSTVCRQLQRVYRKLERESARLLATQYQLNEVAVAEWLEEAREGPDGSVLTALAAE